MVEALFWPALLAYGEAAFAYPRRAHARRDLGRAHRLARADGAARRAGGARRRLPVVELGRLAQPLRLARRRRVPDLGLPSALPPARPRGHAARRRALRRRAARRRDARRVTLDYGNLFLVLHVGFVLAAFAGFTLAAALAGLYLWQERG